MKRALGTMAANWLRKPENQQKIKQTARQLWSRFNDRKRAGTTPAQSTARSDAAADASPGQDRQRRRSEQSGDDPQR